MAPRDIEETLANARGSDRSRARKGALDEIAHFLFGGWEVHVHMEDFFGQSLINVAERVVRLGVPAGFDLPGAAGDQDAHAAALVRIRLCVLVSVDADGIVEQRAVAFGHS